MSFQCTNSIMETLTWKEVFSSVRDSQIHSVPQEQGHWAFLKTTNANNFQKKFYFIWNWLSLPYWKHWLAWFNSLQPRVKSLGHFPTQRNTGLLSPPCSGGARHPPAPAVCCVNCSLASLHPQVSLSGIRNETQLLLLHHKYVTPAVKVWLLLWSRVVTLTSEVKQT